MQFPCFPFCQVVQKHEFFWGCIVKCFLIVYFIGSISAKKYQNHPFTCDKVLARQKWDVVFETRCMYSHVKVVSETFTGISLLFQLMSLCGQITCSDVHTDRCVLWCRSSDYCSSVGKMINCPVLRVNSDYPEASVISLCIFWFAWCVHQFFCNGARWYITGQVMTKNF